MVLSLQCMFQYRVDKGLDTYAFQDPWGDKKAVVSL